MKQIDQLLAFYDQQLAHIKDAIEKLLEQDKPLQEKVARLTAIKGLGLLSVVRLVAETNGFTGFANQGQLVSYAGYDVVENHGAARAVRQALRQNAHL